MIHSILLRDLDNKNENKDSEIYKGILVKIYKSSNRLIYLINNPIFKLWIDKDFMLRLIFENYFRTKSQLFLSLLN